MAYTPGRLEITDEQARSIGNEMHRYYDANITVGPDVYYERLPYQIDQWSADPVAAVDYITQRRLSKIKLDLTQRDFLRLVEDARDGRKQRGMRDRHPMVADAYEQYLVAMALTGELNGTTDL